MHVNEAEFLQGISGFLGSYYVTLAVLNGIAALYVWERLEKSRLALVWLALAVFFLALSPLAFSGDSRMMGIISVPGSIRNLVNVVMGIPWAYSTGTLVFLSLLYFFRKFFVKPVVAWSGLNAALLLMGLSITNPSFATIVTKPDNVPIVGLVFLLGFFTWLGANKAVTNDQRMKQGLEPTEKMNSEKILVWPDLVYTELICMIALTALLLVWGILLQAPLEEPASSVKTPNPSKAPWYFLGLQEMLVYYDPWMAGVVLPSLIIFGLMAIPFIDFNKQGNGYYTIEQRKFAYLTFQFGFLVLWVTLIVLGTFLRGPNWNFFGPYEIWDPHKVEALNNIDLSEYFWVIGLERALPSAPAGAGAIEQIGYIILRELPGILLLAGYLLVMPPLMAMTVFRKFFFRMGFLRFMLLANLLLFMMLLPIKMVLRWTVNLKYIIHIDEYFLNF
ncbi:MAG: hypothetical protein CMJ81_09115 [Planctomycetaceae bacterium]|nr:hypothetical protein [Planctomycetaceae bacterium]MBP62925.1 hypothetical protein [Planctomycetaceae bacterium]